MVKTTVQNMDCYAALNPRFPAAFAAIKQLASELFKKGRYTVDGDAVYVNAAEYDTRAPENGMMEAHRKYIDIMLMLDGEERIAVCPTDALHHVTTPYDETQDALLAGMEADCSVLRMRPGDVAILFPQDAHAPGLDANGTARVRKLICKVAVDRCPI